MRTKDELFRAAQREIAARRQHAVMQAETARRAAYAANPALSAADDAKMRAGLSLARTAALGGDMDTARAALEAADQGRCPRPPRPPVSARKPLPPSSAARCARTPACGAVCPAAVWPTWPPPAPGGDQRRQPAGAVQFSTFDVNRYPDTLVPGVWRDRPRLHDQAAGIEQKLRC